MGAELERLGREVARLEDEALARRPSPPISARLASLRGARVRAAAAAQPGWRSTAWALTAVSVAAAAAALLVVRGKPDGRAPLRFEVAGVSSAGEPGAWVSASAAQELPVSFSDGTTLRLDRNARARVASVSDRGANVVVERGKVNFDVVPRPLNEWTVTLGPFIVHVTGTRFDASWDPVTEVFALAMQEGSVRVTGACLGQTRTAKKGEALRLSCNDAHSAVDTTRPGTAVVAAPALPAEAPIETPPDAANVGAAGAAAEAPPTGEVVQAKPSPSEPPASATGSRVALGPSTSRAPSPPPIELFETPTPAPRATNVSPVAPNAAAPTNGAPAALPAPNVGPSRENTASSRGPTSLSREIGTPAAPAIAPPAAPTGGPSTPGAGAASAAPSSSALPPPPTVSWQALAMAGDYEGALAAVEQQGFASVLASSNTADLKRLGDLSRLAKSPARARAAYEELRRRIPGSDAAAVAAFELGRIAFDDARAFADARRWFSTYLNERPQGALAQEASGRLVEAHERAGDREAARAAARAYLARYPSGPHAALANALIRPLSRRRSESRRRRKVGRRVFEEGGHSARRELLRGGKESAHPFRTVDLLSQMATFVRVVESGSLSKAARRLGLSLPAVSRQLAALEVELGVELISRTTRRLKVTEAGERYYTRCRRVLREVEEAQGSVREGEPRGPLSIAAPISFGLSQIAPRLPALVARHPGLRVDLRLEDQIVDLIGEGVDVSVRVGLAPPEGAALVARTLMIFRQAVVASPAYLRRRGVPKEPAALARHDALMPLPPLGPPGVWRFWRKGVEAQVEIAGAFRSNAPHALREAALAGLGVALLPEWLIEGDVASGALRPLLGDWSAMPVNVLALHRAELRHSACVRAFLEHFCAVRRKSA